MMLFKQNESTAARRRFPVYLVDATDGITPETGEAGGQPQISKNGAAWTNTTNTLVAVGNGGYYVELTQAELDTLGMGMIRYKSANTAEFNMPFQIVAYDPYDGTRMGLSALPNAAPATNGGLPTVNASNYVAGVVAAVTVGTNNDKTGYSLAADQSAVTIGTVNALGTQAKADVNAEVDAALDTAIPATPTANSINERLKALDDNYTSARAANLDNLDAAVSTRSSHSAADVWTQATRTLTAATNITSTGGAIPITAGGLVSSDMTAISGDTIAADNAEKFFDGTGYGHVLAATTIATLTNQTTFTLTDGSADDDAYNGCVMVIEDAVTAAQKAVVVVSDYVGATKTITLQEAPSFTIAASDKVTILADRSLKPTVLNRTLDVAATGEAGIDLGNVTGVLTNANVGWIDANNRIAGIAGTKNTLDDLNDFDPASQSVTVGTNNDKTGYSLAADQSGVTIGTVNALGIQAKADVNAEVDAALDTAIPATPTANSINERLKTLDDNYTAARAANLDNLDAAVSTRSSHSAADVWNHATRTLTAFGFSVTVGTNNDKTGYSLAADQSGVTVGTVNALGTQAKADVNAEVDTALVDIGLDHLLSAAVVGTDVVDNSVVAKLVSSAATADWDTFDHTTDSLQAIRDVPPHGSAMRGTDNALLASSAPANFSSLVISNNGAVDSLVQGFLDTLLTEVTAGRIAGNFDTFFENGDAATTKTVNDVGSATVSGTVNANVVSLTQAALASFVNADTGETTAVAGSVAKIAQGAAGGNVTVGGYAAGQSPADLVLVTPANKLATDANGKVSLAADQSAVTIGTVNALGSSADGQVRLAASDALDTYGPLQPTVAGRKLDVSSEGNAGIDWGNIASKDAVVDLSNTTIKSSVSSIGSGAVYVDHNYGGTDNLRVVDSSGDGVPDVTLTVYRKSDYDAGNTGTSYVVAQSISKDDGRWQQGIMLDPDEYVVVAYKRGQFGPNTVSLTVT